MIGRLLQISKTLEPTERRRYRFLIAAEGLMALADLGFIAMLLAMVHALIGTRSSALSVYLHNNLILFLAVFFLAFLAKNGAGALLGRAGHAFAGRVALRLSGRALTGCQQVCYADWTNTDSSVFIRKVNFHPLEFAHYLVLGSQQLLTQLWLITVAVGAILWFDAGLFLLLLGVLLPPAALMLVSIRKQTASLKDSIRSSNEQSLQFLSEALDSMPETKVFGRQSFFQKRFLDARKKFSAAYFRSISMQQVPARAIETCAVLGLLVLVGVATSSTGGTASLLLKAGAFLAAAYKIIPGLVKLVNLYGQLRTWAFTLDENEPAAESVGKVQRIRTVQAEDLGFRYGNRLVLSRFSMRATRGDFLVITGASGSGKTTLMQVLLGFQDASEGRVLINGEPVDTKNASRFWSSIAYLRQQPFLLHDTLERNITLEAHTANPERLEHVLQVCGLDALARAGTPLAATEIAEKGRNLSGGQRQRVALARALYHGADLFLLDEPFSELDGESERQLLGLLEELAAGGKIILLITHHPENLPASATRINLNETRLVHVGADYPGLRGHGR